ncbi:MAG: hypothetical protein ACREEM_51550, partial [Blastocatellia bacterium]
LVTVVPDEASDPDGFVEGSKQEALANPTKLYARDALPIIDDSDDDGVLHDCHSLHDIKEPVKDMHIDDPVRLGPQTVSVRLHGHAGTSFPFRFLRPCPISWDLTVVIDSSGPKPTAKVTGAHDGFPAYEIYVNNHAVYTRPPIKFSRLCGKLDVSVDTPPIDVGD